MLSTIIEIFENTGFTVIEKFTKPNMLFITISKYDASYTITVSTTDGITKIRVRELYESRITIIKSSLLTANSIRLAVDQFILGHKLYFCDHCNRHIHLCGTCGNNTCNGGYGTKDGKTCPDCANAYELTDEYYRTNKPPTCPTNNSIFGNIPNK